MTDGILIIILLVTGALAFAFGIWAGLGYPGMYDKYDKTGRAPRESPLSWLLRGGRRPLTSDNPRPLVKKEEEEEEEEEEQESRERARLTFDRGRRFR